MLFMQDGGRCADSMDDFLGDVPFATVIGGHDLQKSRSHMQLSSGPMANRLARLGR
jgi:hypothetical protein